MNRMKKIAKMLLGIPLTLISFFFIGKILFTSWQEIEKHIFSANPTLLIIGVFFMSGFFLVRSLAWIKLLELFGEREKSISESVYLYSLAETKRYVPGNIFSFISRAGKFNGKAYSKTIIVKAIILEAFVMVISALLISTPAILQILDFKYFKFIILFLLIMLVIVILLVKVLPKKGKLITEYLQKIFPKKDFFSYINVISISALAWGFFGIANYFLATAVFPNNPNLVILFSSIFVLGWLIGYLSFIAPMGLGVREAVTAFLLAPFLPIYAAAAVAIFTRIFLVISEVIFLSFAWACHKYLKVEELRLKFSGLTVVLFSSFIYVSYFTFFTISRHFNFYSGKFDLGNMENTIWNSVHGNFFIFSNPDGANELSRLSAHADFILLLFAPLYAIYPSVNLLLISQTVVLGLGGIFVYLIAKKILNSEKIAAIFSIGYYLNYFVQEQNIFDFHAVSLATTFLLGAFYFIIEKRYKLFALFLFLAVITKENVYLVSAIFGGFLFIKSKPRTHNLTVRLAAASRGIVVQGEKIFGSLLFIGSFLFFLILMSYIIPNFRGEDHFALEYLSYLGNSTIEVILSPILRPSAFFSRLISPQTLDYIYITFLPVGFLSVFSPLYAIFLLPDFMINLFSSNPNLRSIQYHYGALIVPFVYISSIYGVKKILSKVKNRNLALNIIFYYLLFFILYSTWKFSPLPGLKNSDIAGFETFKNKTDVYNAINLIPNEAIVTATNNIAAHLVQRERIYIIPNGIDIADYLVFFKNNSNLIEELKLYNEEFTVTVDAGDLVIFKRVTSPDRDYRP